MTNTTIIVVAIKEAIALAGRLADLIPKAPSLSEQQVRDEIATILSGIEIDRAVEKRAYEHGLALHDNGKAGSG